jgi:ABC-type hemin transport system ATPase subunit
VAEQVERLLWGYTVAEARTVEATTQLLEALNSPEIAVRELAITHLREMTGRDFDYQASGSEMQRSSAARAWRQLVNRNGGTVLKAVQPPAPNDDP